MWAATSPADTWDPRRLTTSKPGATPAVASVSSSSVNSSTAPAGIGGSVRQAFGSGGSSTTGCDDVSSAKNSATTTAATSGVVLMMNVNVPCWLLTPGIASIAACFVSVEVPPVLERVLARRTNAEHARARGEQERDRDQRERREARRSACRHGYVLTRQLPWNVLPTSSAVGSVTMISGRPFCA